MDFDLLINQHLQWKSKVENYLNEDDSSSIEMDVFVSDEECELGKWLYSEESRLILSKDLLKDIIHIHKEFHYITKTIINNFRNGYADAANELIDDYSHYSDKLVSKIRQLKKEIE